MTDTWAEQLDGLSAMADFNHLRRNRKWLTVANLPSPASSTHLTPGHHPKAPPPSLT